MPLCTNITEVMVRVAVHLVPAQHHIIAVLGLPLKLATGLLLANVRIHVVDHQDHLVAQIIPHHFMKWPLTLQSMPFKLDLPNKL